MQPEKWQEIRVKIKNGFTEVAESKTHDEERREETEVLEFIGPLGKMKVEWTVKPKIIDKKTSYSNRIGSNVIIDYVYSADEFNYIFKAYKWNERENDWEEIKSESFFEK